jgi:hypothetical protein
VNWTPGRTYRTRDGALLRLKRIDHANLQWPFLVLETVPYGMLTTRAPDGRLNATGEDGPGDLVEELAE